MSGFESQDAKRRGGLSELWKGEEMCRERGYGVGREGGAVGPHPYFNLRYTGREARNGKRAGAIRQQGGRHTTVRFPSVWSGVTSEDNPFPPQDRC